ncbi:MAG TPA: PDZ domain-containing protein [Lacipirellulaceae bacterium]|nr:PDZ domain-containing protein [Lacipirellulaceae bacterium]
MRGAFWIATSLLAVAGNLPALAAEFYVAPGAAGPGDGSAARPWPTLAVAQEAIRKSPLRGVEPITVWCLPGTYYLEQPLRLTHDDSGTQAAPIVWASQEGPPPAGRDSSAAVLSGGVRLHGLVWSRHEGEIYKATVPEGLRADQLFVNGDRQIWARYPNFDARQRVFNGFAADAISRERVSRWAQPAGGVIHAMHRNEWGDYSYLITGKDSAGNLTYEGGWQNNRQMGMHPRHRMVEGIFEELDAPGEWFLDTAAKTLYFWPPAGFDERSLALATIEVVRLRELVRFEGAPGRPAAWITLRGFTLRHTARTFMENREPLLRSDWTIYRGGAVMFDGAEDCGLDRCMVDQVGGNAVFVNKYNRRITLRGCLIAGAGANGVAFVGDPDAVRNPLFEYNERHDYQKLDRTPGPRSDNYPADCLVEDCLIYQTGRSEKQTAPVQIAMARRIAVRHCSIYDVPRAGINIGDGCWGGHLIEFCDVFDTVKETGDHGSFNSWGRDRFWDFDREVVDAQVARDPKLPALDMLEPIVLRNNRWRCDHGWDIDLDDGSSFYVIENNLCLNGGIKFREGYHRQAESNILYRNSFHPHVWFANSGDVFARNIVMTEYRPIGMPGVWGASVDFNLLPDDRALADSRRAGRDEHSAAGDPRFVDAAAGDFRLQQDSPAHAVGFKSFPLDRFGVISAHLRRLARTPPFDRNPRSGAAAPQEDGATAWHGLKVKSVTTLGEQSAAGLADIAGVLVVEVQQDPGAPAAGDRLAPMDVIVDLDGQPVGTLADLERLAARVPAGVDLPLGVVRHQRRIEVRFKRTP